MHSDLVLQINKCVLHNRQASDYNLLCSKCMWPAFHYHEKSRI